MGPYFKGFAQLKWDLNTMEIYIPGFKPLEIKSDTYGYILRSEISSYCRRIASKDLRERIGKDYAFSWLPKCDLQVMFEPEVSSEMTVFENFKINVHYMIPLLSDLVMEYTLKEGYRPDTLFIGACQLEQFTEDKLPDYEIKLNIFDITLRYVPDLQEAFVTRLK